MFHSFPPLESPPRPSGRAHFPDRIFSHTEELPQPPRKRVIESPREKVRPQGKRVVSPPRGLERGVGWNHFEGVKTSDQEKPQILRRSLSDVPSLAGPERLFISSGKRVLNFARQRSSAETSLESTLGCNRRIDPDEVRANPDGRAGGRPVRNPKLAMIEYSKDFYKLGGSVVCGMNSKVPKSILNAEDKNLKEKILRERLWAQVRKRKANVKATGDGRNKSLPYSVASAAKAKELERREVVELPDEVKINRELQSAKQQEISMIVNPNAAAEQMSHRSTGSSSSRSLLNKPRRSIQFTEQTKKH